MTRSWKISAKHTTFALLGCLLASNILIAIAHLADAWPAKILLLPCLLFLPGYAILRLLRVTFTQPAANVVYGFGLSLLVLMVSGLAANQFLHLFTSQPLSFWGILSAWNIMTGLLILASGRKHTQPLYIPRWQAVPASLWSWIFLPMSLVLPCLAVMGAFRLNNGGDGLFALLALIYAAGLILYTIVFRNKLSDSVIAWFVFILALSILCMTSLRGWDIVGHDIAREFRVYTLTQMYDHWNIALDRDPYNACLSITILPHMLTELLNLSGLTVFKVLLQLPFAICTVMIYLFLRRYTSKLGALAGVLLFISYPTFINDSAMLTRQGVAYLFFALALGLLTQPKQLARHKLLFLLCSLGAILSHYSTAYMLVGLFTLGLLWKLWIVWRMRKRRKPIPRGWHSTVLTPFFTAMLFIMTFVWYSQITGTSGGVITTIYASIRNIPQSFSDDNRSSDTSTALLFASSKTQADLYESYLNDSKISSASSLAGQVAYMPGLTTDDMPLTPLGEKALDAGINPSIISTLRQQFAKFLQVLAVAGVVYTAYMFFRKRSRAIGVDFICLNFAGLALLALMVILPVLSINYGILRAFQQILVFLILPITLLLVFLGQRLHPRLRLGMAALGTIGVFLLFTGVFAQLLGGTSPSLTMNNRGLYYGLYYTPASDLASFNWMKEKIPAELDVRAANFNRAFMHDPDYPFSRHGILPSQVSDHTYVYLDEAQINQQKFYTYHESSPLIMTFPVEFYDATKNRIYSTSTTGVYR